MCLYGIIGFETLIIVLIFWKTPAFTFLKAGILKLPLIYVIGKDHLGTFKAFRPKAGSASVKGVGLFNLTENSHTLESGAKIPIYFGFRDLAATLLPEYPAIIQEIREAGFLVNNIEDVKSYVRKIKGGAVGNLTVKVRPFKTYKFHDLANMFPNNLDPTFIDSTVQCEVAKFTKAMKTGPMVLMGIVILLIVAAVAVFILQKAFKGSMDPKDCEMMVAAAKCSAQATQAVVSGVPLVG